MVTTNKKLTCAGCGNTCEQEMCAFIALIMIIDHIFQGLGYRTNNEMGGNI